LDRIKEIEITGKEVVVQHNVFLDSPKNLTLQEYKLFMFLISKINPECSDFSTFRVTAIEFAKAIGVENSTYIYRDLQAVAKRLMERVVKISRPESNLIIQTHLISSIYYWCGEGYVDIKISDEMKPYFLNLKREFTQYKLSQITTLSSVYAIKIYELLKKQEILGKRTFFIDDFRKKLDMQSNQYIKISNLKNKVLDISKREINSKTDIKINFKFIKAGRKITAIEFDIKSKAEKKDNQENLYFLNNAVNPKQIREITQFGFSPDEAKSMLDYTDDTIAENAIKAVKNQIKKGNAKNPKAMIKTAIKEKWHDNENEKIEIKKEVEKVQKPIKQRTGFMKIFEYLFRK
jgi:plasmid replication initiation protein